MEVYLDEARLDAVLEPGESLEIGLRRLNARFGTPDRIIVGVKADGVHLLDDQLQEALQRPAASFRCIEVITSPPVPLAMQALREADQALTTVDARRTELAEWLGAGRVQDALNGLTEVLATWQQVHEVVIKSLQLLDFNASELQIEGRRLEAVLETPREQLMQVRDALQLQDYVRLADVLEYEFGEAVNTWHAVIQGLRDAAGGDQGDPRSADRA